MAESGVLSGLLQQALLLSLAVVLLRALRRPLLHLGATAVYASWLLLPALLLTPALPRPAREPLQAVMQVAAAPLPVLRAAALPEQPTSHAAAWLALWLAGAAIVITVQACRQWRLARFGERLPAGSSPALVGLLRPRVALPADFDHRFSPTERQLILAHEQVHRERLDNLWNLLACALTALHWWNPLAWWAARRMQADQELACDAAVLATHPGSRPAYTRALLAAHGLTPPCAPLASRWGSSHPLIERIAMLNQSPSLSRRRTAACGLALLAVVGAVYAAQGSDVLPRKGDDGIRLALSLVIQEGSQVSRSNVSLVGKSGETLRVAIGPRDTPKRVRIDLTPTALDSEKFQLDLAVEGLPASLSPGRPRLIARWGDPASVESLDAKTESRLTVFVVGTRVPLPGALPTPPR